MKDELPTIRCIPDELWTEIEPLLGEEKVPGTRGRPPVAFRKVLDGILCVLRTGCQWKALPREYGSGSTAPRKVPAVGRRGRLRDDMGEAPPKVR